MAMSHNREGPFNPTSPHSSTGVADSFKGTPETRITAFSPDDGSTRSAKVPGSLNLGRRDGLPIKYPLTSPRPLNRSNPFLQVSTSLDKDPFVVNPEQTKLGQKLSPTASSFFPYQGPLVARGTSTEDGFSEANRPERFTQHSRRDSAEPSVQESTATPSFVHEMLSTDTGLSRCLEISSPNVKINREDVDRYIKELENGAFPCPGNKQTYQHGDKVLIRYSNIRGACFFSEVGKSSGRGWQVRSITPRQYYQIVDPAMGFTTAHEGQAYLSVFQCSSGANYNDKQLQTMLTGLLQSIGDLFAFKAQPGAEGSLISAVVEFCDNDRSLDAVGKLHGVLFEGLQLCMMLYRPDMPTLRQMNASHDEMASPVRPSASAPDLLGDFSRLSVAQPRPIISQASSPMYQLPTRSITYPVQPPAYAVVPSVYQGSPISTGAYMMDQGQRSPNALLPTNNYSLTNAMLPQPANMASQDFLTPRQLIPYGRRQNAMRVSRTPHHNPAGSHNHVDTERIEEGTDVRTTIMLRNIPNKVDQAMLKNIVDESSWGKYDFMYLRIDFANDCNVGYAFINFVDPLDIIEFVKARGNQRWNCFKSDKVAEISYATIQGKDCLVQKFRNSSVMLEAEHYRPKLYHTHNGPRPELAGMEEPFPGPDNHSKMKRSCENAEHVGLFTPNAGQHFRDEQRRRRSQFDRGTRLAALEENDFDASTSQRGFYSPI